MYDWTKQAEEMFNSWNTVQQKMWNNWLEHAQGAYAQPLDADQIWQQSLETWEKSVHSTLEAQNQWSEMWVENFSNMANVPPEAVNMVKQGQAIQQNFRNSQQELWQKWFELAKKVQPATMMGGLDGDAQTAFKTWQDSMQQMVNMQSQWMNALGVDGKK